MFFKRIFGRVERIILEKDVYDSLVQYSKITQEFGVEYGFRVVDKIKKGNSLIVKDIENVATPRKIEVVIDKNLVQFGSSIPIKPDIHTHPILGYKLVDYFDLSGKNEDYLESYFREIAFREILQNSGFSFADITRIHQKDICGIVHYIGNDNIAMECLNYGYPVMVYYREEEQIKQVPRLNDLEESEHFNVEKLFHETIEEKTLYKSKIEVQENGEKSECDLNLDYKQGKIFYVLKIDKRVNSFIKYVAGILSARLFNLF